MQIKELWNCQHGLSPRVEKDKRIISNVRRNMWMHRKDRWRKREKERGKEEKRREEEKGSEEEGEREHEHRCWWY